MKKLYMILAAFSLLSMSLNAQVANPAQKFKAINKAQMSGMDKGQPAQSNGAVLRAPNRYNAADGEFLVGPYTTDDYGTTGKGLYVSNFSYPSGRVDITAVLNRSEIEQYIGQEIVGYRFATTGTVSCYSFIVSIEGPNHWVDDIHVFNLQSSGTYYDVSGTQWHEFYLDEPVTFEVPDTTIAVWIGYKYFQETSSSDGYSSTPILVNPNSTSHSTYAYSYSNKAFYDVTSHLGGDLAAQLIFKTTVQRTPSPTINMVNNGDGTYTITATGDGNVTLTIGNQTETGTGSASITIAQGNADQTVTATATAQDGELAVSNPTTENFTIPALPKTDTPTITYQVTETSVIITATGNGTVTLTVGGQTVSGDGSATITITRTPDEQTVTATATAVEPNHQVSDPATQNITIPEAGRSPMPTITWTDNGDGTYTITVNGTGEIAVYIADSEHAGEPIATVNNSFSFNVEQHSQAMTITVQATNQEEGLTISRTAEETYTIPAMTIGNDFQELDPQPANASTPIDMKGLMFVDRFGKVIPNENNHPRLYTYTLEETQVRQRTSNSIPVEVKHTGSDGLGFYSLNQIDNDTARKLEMDVRNAAIDLPLENDPGIYYYTASRSTKTYPDQADRKYFGVLQRTSDGNYSETLNPSYDWQQEYPGGKHHIHYDRDTVYGELNDYLTYVPIVWTMGFDRVNYEADHIHNSYGAPKWRTGVADVRIENLNAERQKGYMGSTNWMDGTDSVSMYMLTLDAIGTMPTVNTMPYEPYMFRVFVESKNGKLRGYKHVGEDVYNDGSHFEGDGTGPLTGPICVWSEYVKGSDRISVNGLEYTFHKEKESQYNDPEHPDHWIAPDEANIMFAALNKLETEGEGELEHIKTDELNVYVRFYYIVAGSADNHVPGGNSSMALRAEGDGEAPAPGEGDAPAGYGTESPGTPPNPSTSVKEMRYHGEVVSTTYVNAQGMQSDKPFKGVNIVVTRYTDGTTSTTKVIR